ncbi:transketolase-like protein 2 [Glandiceps talaboti]
MAEADEKKLIYLRDIANRLRIHSIRATDAAGSGHPTSCCSMAEIMSVLFFHQMRYKVKEPKDPANDRLVLSKGHAAPILYAAWAETGLFPVEELLKLRKIDSDLEGHPTPRSSFIDVATGSLGQGLSVACGMAYVGKHYDKADYRVYCVIGDGESAEGSIWEAMHFASHYKLDNLVAIFDINRLGQCGVTTLQHDMETYCKRTEAFGWNTYIVDGHDVAALCKVLYDATTVSGKPTCILAKTIKGKGIPVAEDRIGYHGKGIISDKAEETINAIQELIQSTSKDGICPSLPLKDVPPVNFKVKLSEPPNYKKGEKLPIRVSYGSALIKLGKDNEHVIALDGDTETSTFSNMYLNEFPDRFIECFIAEQNMVGIAIGATCRNRTIAFASSFAAFLTRAYDQIRMGAISQTNINLCGSHCGVCIGPDGASQMGLEDLAMFRSIPTSTVFYPSDAVSTERAVELAANTNGICYIRITRPPIAVIYNNDEVFQVGKAKVVSSPDKAHVTVVGAGITLHEALIAAEKLAREGIKIRVVDLFTIKPIDIDTLAASASQTDGKVLTVEDHHPEGGIGEAVSRALSTFPNITVRCLAVSGIPRSGQFAELLEMFNISHDAIIKNVKEMVQP